MAILLNFGGMRADVDDVRYMANSSTGFLGLAIAESLAYAGLRARVVCGWTPHDVHLSVGLRMHDVTYAPTFEAMKLAILEPQKYSVGIFAAAVLDYLPERILGKRTSNAEPWSLKLWPTPKLVDLWKLANPNTPFVTFKLESGCSDEELVSRALESNRNRMPKYIVANRREDISESDYRGFLLGPLSNKNFGVEDSPLQIYRSRLALAKALVAHLVPLSKPSILELPIS